MGRPVTRRLKKYKWANFANYKWAGFANYKWAGFTNFHARDK